MHKDVGGYKDIAKYKFDQAIDDFYLASKADTDRQIEMSKNIVDEIKLYLDNK